MEQKNPIPGSTVAIVVAAAVSVGAGAALSAQLAFSSANPNAMKARTSVHRAAVEKPSTESSGQYDEWGRKEEIVRNRTERIRSQQQRADIHDVKFSDDPATPPSNRVVDQATLDRYIPARAPEHRSAAEIDREELPEGTMVKMTQRRAERLCRRDGVSEVSRRYAQCVGNYIRSGSRIRLRQTRLW